MKYVYLIQSIPFQKQKYTGITTDVFKRLEEHNSGKSVHTSKYKPWKLVTYITFTNEERAFEFELYLKSGSGRAFAEKHFWNKTE
jgi:putative endonuclease